MRSTNIVVFLVLLNSAAALVGAVGIAGVGATPQIGGVEEIDSAQQQATDISTEHARDPTDRARDLREHRARVLPSSTLVDHPRHHARARRWCDRLACPIECRQRHHRLDRARAGSCGIHNLYQGSGALTRGEHGVAAGVLEELVHATAARPWAVSQNIRLTGVTTEIPDSCSRKVDIWISLAPFFVGLVALALLYLGIGIPPLTPTTQLAIAAWGYFTLPSLVDLQQAAGVSHGQRAGLSKRARRGVTLYCLGWLCMIGGDELGVLLLGSPAQLGLIPKPPFVAPPVTAQTVASGVFWLGVMVALGSVVILVTAAKNETEK